jgi:hypothetical protein
MRVRDRVASLAEGVVIAIDALRANKVRAALTILGIAIGVFVVVLMSAVIHGINSSVAQEFERAGPTTFFVYRFPIALEGCSDDEDTCKWRSNPPLRVGEATAIQRLASVQDVTIRSGTQAPAKFRDRVLGSAQVEAYTANWVEVAGGDIVQGRNFTPAEATNGARVAVINETMAERLFNGIDPLGKDVLLNKSPFIGRRRVQACQCVHQRAAARGVRAVRSGPALSQPMDRLDRLHGAAEAGRGARRGHRRRGGNDARPARSPSDAGGQLRRDHAGQAVRDLG